MSATGEVKLDAGAAQRWASALLEAEGARPDSATTVAQLLVLADLRGHDTHGMVRIPAYVTRIRAGALDPAAVPSVERVAPAAARVDGHNGFGFVAASRATQEAIALAQDVGVGFVGVRRSNHFGMAACYLTQALAADLCAFVFTNAAPALPPWGGRTPLFGTNPFAVAIPGGEEGPLLLDMAPTVVARGKIRRAQRQGVPIPEGWALDADGRPTADAAAALAGVLMPIGAHKGAGLSVALDIVSGLMTGAAFGGDVADQGRDLDRPADVGHAILAFRPDLFLPRAQVARRMDELVRRIRGAPRAADVERIMVPGEPEALLEAERRAEGVPYRVADLAALVALSDERGVSVPAPARRPGAHPGD